MDFVRKEENLPGVMVLTGGIKLPLPFELPVFILEPSNCLDSQLLSVTVEGSLRGRIRILQYLTTCTMKLKSMSVLNSLFNNSIAVNHSPC